MASFNNITNNIVKTGALGVGAVVGWLAVDKVIIEMDEVLNREEFEEDLRNLIAKQQEEIKIEIRNSYLKSLKSFADD